MSAGVDAAQIAVISPYSAQVSLLKSIFEDMKVRVGTVDGFQGQEEEIVIITLVRSNNERKVGFLADQRRLNVAITRPRRHLCVIGNNFHTFHEGFIS